ncbi:MAG: glycosyltransferase [Hyphomicrobiales bacterium]
MPGLNVLAAPFLMLAAVRSILRRGDVAAVMVYNFDPSLVVITLYLKFFFDGVLLQNVEDVSEPRFADWMPGSRARPLQQLLFWICMHVIARMVHGYVIPTRRFLAYLPSRKKQAVITGCIDIQAELSAADPPPLRVLYAGKIEPEHGSVAFLEALKLLDGMDAPPQIEVDISGRSTNCVGLEAELSELRHIRARSHGFVSKQAYRDLLSQAHVCLALQDPKGRYADFKTPSKVYEFLAFGKAVVSTNVGDIAEIGEKVLVLLPELSGAALAAAIGRLAKDPATAVALREAALRYAEQHFSYAAVGEVLCALISSEVQKCSSK